MDLRRGSTFRTSAPKSANSRAQQLVVAELPIWTIRRLDDASIVGSIWVATRIILSAICCTVRSCPTVIAVPLTVPQYANVCDWCDAAPREASADPS